MAYGETVSKDPQDVLDIGFDWDEHGLLTNRSTSISSSSWTIPAGLTTAVAGTNTSTKTLIYLSGGTLGETYTVVNHVILANGAEFDRKVYIRVRSL